MLKRPDDQQERDQRPIGELISQLVDDGKAYAQAEADVAKAIVAAKVRALAWPAGVAFVALLCSQATITILAVGLFIELDSVMNPLLAGLIASLVFAGITSALAWLALRRLRQIL